MICTASMPPRVRCPVSVVSQTYLGSVSSITRRTSRSRSMGPQIWGCGASLDPHGNRLPADLVEGVGESLQLIVARTAGRPRAHIALPMVAAERLEKIARERHMIGNGLRDLIRIDEVCRLAGRAVGRVDERDARIIEELLERHRIAPILLDPLRVRLDALQSQRGDPFDRPLDVVMARPRANWCSRTECPD